jgi:hypothetical protein
MECDRKVSLPTAVCLEILEYPWNCDSFEVQFENRADVALACNKNIIAQRFSIYNRTENAIYMYIYIFYFTWILNLSIFLTSDILLFFYWIQKVRKSLFDIKSRFSSTSDPLRRVKSKQFFGTIEEGSRSGSKRLALHIFEFRYLQLL